MTHEIQTNNVALALGTSLTRSLWRRRFLFILFTLGLASLTWLPAARATCNEGCDTVYTTTFLGDDALANFNSGGSEGFDTAIGAGALFADTSGRDNVAVGVSALTSNTTGNNNTAIGSGTMVGGSPGPTGNNNTAIGYEALFIYTTASNNTASGYQALFKDTTGSSNVATGYSALYFNTTGSFNTATGRGALYKNTASDNTAMGYQAMNKNTSAPGNTAIGYQALFSNTTAGNNTATGSQSLYNSTGIGNTGDGEASLYSNTTGGQNTALGNVALYENTTGSNNIAVGSAAGFNLTTGSNNIDIGNFGLNGEWAAIRVGTVGTQTNTYIAGINGVTVAGGIGVIVDSNGHLGTSTSSARYKENIQPMEKASEAILSLQPVPFHYKKELDPKGVPQFGLVAEQVAKVNPDLVARDEHGRVYSVRYEAVNAMLLNEFLKEHSKVTQQTSINLRQEATITELKVILAKQQKEIGTLKAGLERVSDRLDAARPVGRLARNNE